MKELRPYQRDLMLKYYESLSKGFRRPLIQSPTGSGKSILMMEILKSSVEIEKPIIMIAHKEELINQLQTHFIKRFGIEPTVIADRSRYKYNPENPYCVASIQGWMSRLNRGLEIPSNPHVILIDEAHHSSSPSYSTLINHYQDVHIVGLTATPYRIDGRGFKYLDNGIEGFDILLKGPAVLDLIEQGYLSEVKFFTANKTIKSSGLKVIGGEYSAKDLKKRVKETITPDDVVETWMKLSQGKKTILYPVSVDLSKEYCDAFNDYGITAAHIDASTSPTERKAILDDFRHGKINVLCQHSIVIEGVDIADVECVQFVRATNSLNIWWQAIGRGMRPHSDKKYLIVIDHADNTNRLPSITTPLEFFLEPTSLDPNHDVSLTKCPCCNHYYQKNETDYRKLRLLEDLDPLEISIFHEKHKDQIADQSLNFENRVLTGFFIDLICPKCNQNFSQAHLAPVQNKSSEDIEIDEDFDIPSEENPEGEILIKEYKPRNKEEIFTIIKTIARYKCSKVKRLAYLDYELGIKNLDDEELKLFVNDCQAKKGWLYYIRLGRVLGLSKYLEEIKRERNIQKQISLLSSLNNE